MKSALISDFCTSVTPPNQAPVDAHVPKLLDRPDKSILYHCSFVFGNLFPIEAHISKSSL